MEILRFETCGNGPANTGNAGGDGLGDSSAPTPKAKGKASTKQPETVDA